MRAAHGVLCSRVLHVQWAGSCSYPAVTGHLPGALQTVTGILRGPECPERKRHRASRCSGGVSMGGWPLRVSLASAQGSCPAVVPSS